MHDKNLSTIKSIVSSLGDYEVYLFGSRARGDNSPDSDYDIIVVSKDDMDVRTKMIISSKITKNLADKGISSDVLVRSIDDIKLRRNWTGSVIQNAVENWIRL